jgi:hypothetical protein
MPPGPPVLETSDALRELLTALGLEEFAGFLREALGIVRPSDLPYVTDEELHAQGMHIVQIRQLRDRTGPACAAAHILVGTLPDAGARACDTDFDHTNPVGCAPLETIEEHADQSDDLALPGRRSPHTAEEEALLIASHTEGKRVETERTLLSILARDDMMQRHDIRVLIHHALDGVAPIDPTLPIDFRQAARSAADALMSTSRALAACHRGPLRDAVAGAERSARDHLIWRTQIQCSCRDRGGFISTICEALGMSCDTIDRNMLSSLLHCHNLQVTRAMPWASFLSEAKMSGRKRGARAARLNRSTGGNNLGPETVSESSQWRDHPTEDHVGGQHPGGDQGPAGPLARCEGTGARPTYHHRPAYVPPWHARSQPQGGRLDTRHRANKSRDSAAFQ